MKQWALALALFYLPGPAAHAMCVPSEGYEKHSDGWYYGAKNKVQGIDKQSFHVLDPVLDPNIPCVLGSEYAADKLHVYLHSNVIARANPSTFLVLKDGYSRDAHNIYYLGTILEGADQKSFTCVGSSNIFRDALRIYANGKVVENADAVSFELLDGSSFRSIGIAHDKNHVFFFSYHGASEVRDACTGDFKSLRNLFWSSNRTVFYCDKPVMEADFATFSVPKQGELAFMAEDRDHYFVGDLLHQQVLKKSECRRVGPIVLACKDYIFCGGHIYSGLDPASIRYVGISPSRYMRYHDVHGDYNISGDGIVSARETVPTDSH